MGSPAGLGITGVCPASSEPLAMIKKWEKKLPTLYF